MCWRLGFSQGQFGGFTVSGAGVVRCWAWTDEMERVINAVKITSQMALLLVWLWLFKGFMFLMIVPTPTGISVSLADFPAVTPVKAALLS